jgi:hypothetical protein
VGDQRARHGYKSRQKSAGMRPTAEEGGVFMCDYSLHAFPNRLAIEGEHLLIHRFGGGSLGLASPADLEPARRKQADCPRRWSWAGLQSWFEAKRAPVKRIQAVCIPPGAKLILKDIPRGLQRELGVEEVEEVTFVETSANVNTYRDAVLFANQRQILLQALREGQRAEVLSLELAERENEPARAEERREAVLY